MNIGDCVGLFVVIVCVDMVVVCIVLIYGFIVGVEGDVVCNGDVW